jgi:4-amino-4-deoxy-L-arabinose transferase-like glycosyltransferase
LTTSAPARAPAGAAGRAAADIRRFPGRARSLARDLPLLAVLALSAVMNTNRLSQNGFANVFYSAGVKSMLLSLHNFLFVSSDPGGLITIDKPPLGLWLQTASAKIFGFSPASLLLPEAILGVLSVGALYWVMVKHFGRLAALAGALTLAIFPSFVAVSRDNTLDALLIFLMILACGLALRACASGRLTTLMGSALIVALAFNTKTLAGLVVVPGIALAYLLCAPGELSRRIRHLLAAGILMVLVCGAWIALVELTPASQRPFVGGSTNDTELNLTFAYNGFGRVEGQKGGPERITLTNLPEELLQRRELEALPAKDRRSADLLRGVPRRDATRGQTQAGLSSADERHRRLPRPIAFAAAAGPVRMFEVGLDTQGAWLLPFAFCGLLAMALLLALTLAPAREPVGDGRSPSLSWRRDARLAGLIVLGGFFLVELLLLSFSKGIIHPYYVSALGPGAAAMCGAGLAAFGGLLAMPSLRTRAAGLGLLAAAVAGSLVATLVILEEDSDYLSQIRLPLIALAAAGLLAAGTIALRRPDRSPLAVLVLLLCVLLIVPGVYSATTWEVPVEGTFPEAGPHQAEGTGGVGVNPAGLRTDLELIHYVRARDPGRRWAILTQASDVAAPLILLGLNAAALGGYSADDPVLGGPQLAHLVARGEARYVLIGGNYSTRGGNAASNAVLRACTLVPASAWQGPGAHQGALVVFDCRGRERQLAAA